jgi:indolepyruvate ferredoxin oxidoreductase alpha subunit
MDLVSLVRALGISDVQLVDPDDMKATRAAIKQATGNADDLSVIIFRSPCVFLRDSFVVKDPYFINGNCTGCGVCTSLGCPALSRDPQTSFASIDLDMCVGCGQCAQYCNFDAIEQLKGRR